MIRHSWDLTPRQAAELQQNLRAKVRTDLVLSSVGRVAGVDVGYRPRSRESVAAVAILSYPELELVESSRVRLPTQFPYVPGLLSFREMPAILEAVEGLRDPPDLILVDGQGQAHPRRFGIASHLGLWLQIPTVGVAKTRLCGTYEPPGAERGRASDLVHQGEVVGQVLRTRSGVKPVFVSVGYGLPLEDCVRWTLTTAPRYRLPEPIRHAHRLASDHV